MKNKIVIWTFLTICLAGCSTAKPTSSSSAFLAKQQAAVTKSVLEKATVVHLRMRSLTPGSELFNELEAACQNKKQIEVILPMNAEIELLDKKICFPVFISKHPAASPRLDVMLVDNADIYVGRNYFGSNTADFKAELEFQKILKTESTLYQNKTHQ